jgi:thiamine-phosphate pyrophosphorylase
MDKRKILKEARLYVLLDQGLLSGRDMEEVTLRLVNGGAQIVQYRDKISEDKEYLEDALVVQKILRKARIPLIINDRLDIAWYINADGVHLGQEDLPVKIAKKLLKKDKIIGGSAETVEQAVEAQRVGADYIGVGPMFHTTTKEIKEVKGIKLLEECLKKVKIPCFAIGGINLENLGLISAVGCHRVVVGSAILNAPDVPEACREFLKRLA